MTGSPWPKCSLKTLSTAFNGWKSCLTRTWLIPELFGTASDRTVSVSICACHASIDSPLTWEENWKLNALCSDARSQKICLRSVTSPVPTDLSTASFNVQFLRK